MLWSIMVFSVALSLDGFGVGLAYGLRKIRIPLPSFLVICLSSATAVAFSMCLGRFVASCVSGEAAELIGAFSLIAVGTWILLQNFVRNIMPASGVYQMRVPGLGIMIKILKEPEEADFDQSGEISIKEAFFLGMALAMDALGAGFGAAMSGFNPFLTTLAVALAKFILVAGGLFLGSQYSLEKVKGEVSLVPGGLILILGLKKLIHF